MPAAIEWAKKFDMLAYALLWLKLNKMQTGKILCTGFYQITSRICLRYDTIISSYIYVHSKADKMASLV